MSGTATIAISSTSSSVRMPRFLISLGAPVKSSISSAAIPSRPPTSSSSPLVRFDAPGSGRFFGTADADFRFLTRICFETH